MCGLAGFWDAKGRLHGDEPAQVGRRMARRVSHRGPDDEGVWTDARSGIVLAHRRLAILGLGPAGHQPAASPCGRYAMAFNGEIYNHRALRRLLEQEGHGASWRGGSDTETLLACISAWGVARTIDAATGMFAIALWDSEARTLVLVRDRLGEKPLYYGWQGDTFLFGSEPKALMAHPAFDAAVDRGALSLLLRHNCVPAPYSIFEGIAKLPAGCMLRLECREGAPRMPQPEPYWSVTAAAAQGLANPFEGSGQEAANAMEERLREAVCGQMLSDVPLGAFLSGGIDSSLVVALMQAQSASPVRTFTIGFGGGGYDEAADARAVARHLGTDHTELTISARDALDVIPLMSEVYCEPFGDSSQIPTYLVSRLARQHVKVALSGDGGDEVFGGYNRYLGARVAWERLNRLPRPARHVLAGLLRALPPHGWDALAGAMKPLLPRSMHLATPGEKAHKLALVLPLTDSASYYRALTSHWADPGSVVIGGTEPPTRVADPAAWLQSGGAVERMMAMDAQTYLADDIMVKVDRASMANSLETRAPFLDHRVFEFAWRLPMDAKVRGSRGKLVLRELLARHVPQRLFERPKMGFGVPLDAWLRGPLRQWAETLLDESLLRQQGMFHPGPVRRMWREHLDGRVNRQHHLWTILMFQAWLLEHAGGSARAWREG